MPRTVLSYTGGLGQLMLLVLAFRAHRVLAAFATGLMYGASVPLILDIARNG